MLLHPFWSGRELRRWTQSSKETPEVAWENSAVSEQLARAGRAARRGGMMWLSGAVGRRMHTLPSEALGSWILRPWLWFGVKGLAPGCWTLVQQCGTSIACVRPFLISVLTWCVMFWRQWFCTDALRWWVKCSDIYIFPQAPWNIVFLYFLGEKEESGNCVGGCCFDWRTQALKIINLGVLPGIFCLFFFNSELVSASLQAGRKIKCKTCPMLLSQEQCWVSGECGLRAAAFPVVAWGSSIPKCVLSCMRAQSSYLKQ